MSWIRQYVVVFLSGTTSMFLGASLVHNLLQPDLTLPEIQNIDNNNDSGNINVT
jgi:hypothetical protein